MSDTKSTQAQSHSSHLPRPIVAKFGSSSGADADQVRKIAALVCTGAEGKISITPVHLDLTAYALMPSLKEWDRGNE